MYFFFEKYVITFAVISREYYTLAGVEYHASFTEFREVDTNMKFIRVNFFVYS